MYARRSTEFLHVKDYINGAFENSDGTINRSGHTSDDIRGSRSIAV